MPRARSDPGGLEPQGREAAVARTAPTQEGGGVPKRAALCGALVVSAWLAAATQSLRGGDDPRGAAAAAAYAPATPSAAPAPPPPPEGTPSAAPVPPPPPPPSPPAPTPAPATESPSAGAGEEAKCALEEGAFYDGRGEGPLRDLAVGSVAACAVLCLEVTLCAYFNFRQGDRRCHLFSGRGPRHADPGHTAGDCFGADPVKSGGEAPAPWGPTSGTPPAPPADGGGAALTEGVHLSVSVACSAFYHWQAQTLLWTAQQVGHRGGATVIVVGCDTQHHGDGGAKGVVITHQREQDRRVPPRQWRKLTGPPGWRLHFAPSTPEAAAFPWYNKPWSFVHWRRHSAQPVREPVVVVLDPDEFFLAPLVEPGRGGPSMTSVGELNGTVAPGRAVAQQYGIGSSWLRFAPRTCPEGSRCLSLGHAEASRQYSVGPPMMLHAGDTERVFGNWLSFMNPVLAQPGGKDILADMWAYSMSAAHHHVTHDRYDHMMVSNTQAHGEGWHWVEQITGMPCRDPFPFLRNITSGRVPTLVHCASHGKAGIPEFTAGEHARFHSIHDHPRGGELWNFHKGHVPPDFLSCDEPLIVPPPDDLFRQQTSVRGRREAFYVCVNIAAVNSAAAAYKRANCAEERLNLRHCTRLSITHEQARNRAPPGAPRYPLAYRVC